MPGLDTLTTPERYVNQSFPGVTILRRVIGEDLSNLCTNLEEELADIPGIQVSTLEDDCPFPPAARILTRQEGGYNIGLRRLNRSVGLLAISGAVGSLHHRLEVATYPPESSPISIDRTSQATFIGIRLSDEDSARLDEERNAIRATLVGVTCKPIKATSRELGNISLVRLPQDARKTDVARVKEIIRNTLLRPMELSLEPAIFTPRLRPRR